MTETPPVLCLGVAVILVVMLAGCRKSVDVPSGKTTPAAIPVAANDLFSAYKADEAAADSQYKEKLLEVTGVIGRVDIDKHGVGSAVLVRTPGDGVPLVLCDGIWGRMSNGMHFGSKADFDRLASNQTVVMRGTCAGLIGPTVRLVECRVMKIEANATSDEQRKH